MNGTQVDSAAEATHPPAGGDRLVVGLDGSVGSLAALRWAAQEARLHGGAVHAVMAWQHPQAYGAPNIWGLGMDASLDTETLLASATAEAARLGEQAGRSPDVVITTEAVEGHPAEVLLGAANGADLLVVGSRGHGGFVGSLLGSVSQHLVAHSRCPVVVVPNLQHDAAPADDGSSEHAEE